MPKLKQKREHIGLKFIMNLHAKERNNLAQTPEELLEDLTKIYGEFDFDPCPPDPQFDGLTADWGKNNFVNPPFSNLNKWLLKAIEEWKKGKQVILLMPARLHPLYFIENAIPLLNAGLIQFVLIPGGVRFKGYKQRAPFGMIYLVFPKGFDSIVSSIPVCRIGDPGLIPGRSAFEASII